MSKELFRSKEFCFLVFSSTQHALKAEKTLLSKGEDCMIIPTPQEVSSNCSLAIKFNCNRFSALSSYLRDEKLSIDGAYLLDAQGIRLLTKEFL